MCINKPINYIHVQEEITWEEKTREGQGHKSAIHYILQDDLMVLLKEALWDTENDDLMGHHDRKHSSEFQHQSRVYHEKPKELCLYSQFSDGLS